MLCASLLLAAPAAAQSVKAGIDAWQRGDYVGAVAIWRPLAEAGDADASFNMGQAYRLGRGVLVDLGDCAELARARGAARAMSTRRRRSGCCSSRTATRPTACKWLKGAAEDGEPRAMLVYGTALFNGDGVPQDPVLGYAYVSRSAAQGLEPAKSTLAQMDEIMPLEQRKKGVALAMQKAKTPARANAAQARQRRPRRRRPQKPPAPAPAPQTALGKRRMADPARRFLAAIVGRSLVQQAVRKRARRGPPAIPRRRRARSPGSRSAPSRARRQRQLRAARCPHGPGLLPGRGAIVS